MGRIQSNVMDLSGCYVDRACSAYLPLRAVEASVSDPPKLIFVRGSIWSNINRQNRRNGLVRLYAVNGQH